MGICRIWIREGNFPLFTDVFKTYILDARYRGRFFKAAAVFAVGVAPQLKVTGGTPSVVPIWVNPNLGRMIFNFTLPGQHQRAAIGDFIGDVADIIQAGVVALDVVVVFVFLVARPISIQVNRLSTLIRCQVIMNAFSVPAVSDRVDQREGVLAITFWCYCYVNLLPCKISLLRASLIGKLEVFFYEILQFSCFNLVCIHRVAQVDVEGDLIAVEVVPCFRAFSFHLIQIVNLAQIRPDSAFLRTCWNIRVLCWRDHPPLDPLGDAGSLVANLRRQLGAQHPLALRVILWA